MTPERERNILAGILIIQTTKDLRQAIQDIRTKLFNNASGVVGEINEVIDRVVEKALRQIVEPEHSVI
jgi:hypothetical protein